MSSFSIRLGTTRNQQRDRDWNKKHITEIHSSFVFEKLLSSHVSRQIEHGALQFNSHAVVGIELLEASETKTYTQHTFDDTHHQVLIHEFISETMIHT